ncbi:hypothetical protein [Paraburkholderia sp. 32]|uniref:hypothetical protein n=1 Tax=Paraburkholderia sp. 32 TaxID=2991057 RepID=UPI003D25CD3A
MANTANKLDQVTDDGAKQRAPVESTSAQPERATVHEMPPLRPIPSEWRPTNSEWMSHPLTAAEIPLQTPTVQRMYETVQIAAKSRISGRYFKAAHDDGVTETLRALREMLEESVTGLCTVYHAFAPGRTEETERKLYNSFLMSVTGTLMPGAVNDLRGRLLNRLCELASKSASRTLVLLLDDLEHITEWDVGLIRHMRHAMHDQGFGLTVFSGGHDPDMNVLDDRIRKGKLRAEVWNEVKEAEVEFTSAGSIEDVHDIFQSIDQQQHAGVTWTTFFLPEACGRRFSLAEEIENFKGALGMTSKKARTDPFIVGIPIRSLIRTVLIFFHFASEFELGRLTPDVRFKCWQQAIEWVRLIEVVNGKCDAGIFNGGQPR